MKVGLRFPTPTTRPDQVREKLTTFAMKADQAGFASLWVMDHFYISPAMRNNAKVDNKDAAPTEILEAWSTLAFMAGITHQIKLGTMVSGVTYRFPGYMVKVVDTLDALSGGRAYFGIGAAWEQDEHARLGIPFPSTAERFEMLEEQLQIALQMWSRDSKPYEGKHYHLSSTAGNPLFIQRPHPPILVGGSGEKKTLRLVAQYADACNIGGRGGMDELRRKLEILRAHCQAVGRPYEQIEKTTGDLLKISRDGRDNTTTPSAVLEKFGQLAELGFEHVIVSISDDDPASFDLLATDILPAAQKIPVKS
jgi:F420-dependent oxidoreductase-like protein